MHYYKELWRNFTSENSEHAVLLAKSRLIISSGLPRRRRFCVKRKRSKHTADDWSQHSQRHVEKYQIFIFMKMHS